MNKLFIPWGIIGLAVFIAVVFATMHFGGAICGVLLVGHHLFNLFAREMHWRQEERRARELK